LFGDLPARHVLETRHAENLLPLRGHLSDDGLDLLGSLRQIELLLDLVPRRQVSPPLAFGLRDSLL
jgi:hypothetical protein